jgi:hypothetical protein
MLFDQADGISAVRFLIFNFSDAAYATPRGRSGRPDNLDNSTNSCIYWYYLRFFSKSCLLPGHALPICKASLKMTALPGARIRAP